MTTSSAATPRAPRLGPDARVVLLSLLLLGAGVALGAAALPNRPALAHAPPGTFALLAVGFAAAEWSGLRIAVVEHVQTVSLSELPYVLALFFLPPAETVLARTVATAIVVALRHRSTSVKTTFNVALWVCEASVAAAVTTYAAAPGADPLQVRTWAGVAAGVLAGPALFSAVATTSAMALYERRFSARDLGAAVVQQLPLSLAVALPSLVVAVALLAAPAAAALVLPSFVVMAVAYRSYSSLYRSHRALRGLYTFTHKVSGSYEVDPVLRQVLVEARSLLGVSYAEIMLEGGTLGGGLRASIAGDRLLTVPLRPEEPLPAALRAARPALLHARGAEPRLARWLTGRDLSAAVIAPLPGDGGAIGLVLVGVTEGGVQSFTRGDVELLASLAEQASVAIRHANLLGQLRHSSDHDGLTGLANRTVLHREIDRNLARVAAGEQRSLAVLALDLDGFKDVNDGFGHAHGDAVLIEVARRLTATVPPGATLARLGGDEFALVLADHDAATVLQLAERIRGALEDPVEIGADHVGVGASVGAAVAASVRAAQVLTTAALLQRADLAMYAAKGSDHTPRLWEPALENRASQRGPLLGELRRAIHERAITVQVQPQVDTRTGDLTSVEVLARWLHADLGEVPPSTFVPVAERGGLMAPLTELVLDGALAAHARWAADGVVVPVAVNVSARDVDNPRLVGAVRRGLAEHRVAPGQLTLELTETSVMADPERSAAIFRELKSLGVRLSIDDFGTGWSSLAQLQRITVDELKVDRSFVRHLATNDGDAAIVRSVLDLGRNLGMGVVAEGVEDAGTLRWLAEAGCDRVQGYHVSRPMAPDQLLVWLRGRHVRAAGWLSLAG